MIAIDTYAVWQIIMRYMILAIENENIVAARRWHRLARVFAAMCDIDSVTYKYDTVRGRRVTVRWHS
jgi:hypothetical protein